MSNRLAQTDSLYLQKHAENPIDWWPWCDEALETAQQDDKPIFLSVGYSSCHWCTVMEGEAFSDSAIADYMNANFLPIKVDREERPDLDSIYMQALQMMTSQGGWPLNIFLTPDERIPFYGGTYFPVEPRYGRPGFLDVLRSIRRFYDVEKEKLGGFKQEIMKGLQQGTVIVPNPPDSLTKELLQQGIENNTRVISGLNYAPSFPMMPYTQLALQGSWLTSQGEAVAPAALKRGSDLVKGGIYDHVGGGFHRYTVDATWTVPHFEKMLYDNGQIVEFLANLWSAGVQEPAFKRAIAGTVQWLKREMTAPQGYFYAAQDADNFVTPEEVEPEEGAFYVWSYEELQKLLTPEEFAALEAKFTISAPGNFEGKNVLQRRDVAELPEDVEEILTKLFAVRYGKEFAAGETFSPARNNQEAKSKNWAGRIPPVTDTKMIVAWNSLMISGLARAYGVFGEQEYLDLAVEATNFILENQWVRERFHRLNYEGKVAVLAQSEDYALFIKALLDLQTVSPQNTNWLDKAVEIQEEFDHLLWCLEMGGYFNTAPDGSKDLLIRERSYLDNATPAANGVAIANLMRLALLKEDKDYQDRAEQALQAFGSVMSKSPTACPSLFSALDWFRNGALIQAKPEQLQTLISQYLPTCAYQLDANLPEETFGLVCRDFVCLKPAKSWRELKGQVIGNGH
ncbi:MAG: thioredoxin domain-containing protein [Spirulinaceae cyanobacterium]